jgi:hypothetical protein
MSDHVVARCALSAHTRPLSTTLSCQCTFWSLATAAVRLSRATRCCGVSSEGPGGTGIVVARGFGFDPAYGPVDVKWFGIVFTGGLAFAGGFDIVLNLSTELCCKSPSNLEIFLVIASLDGPKFSHPCRES